MESKPTISLLGACTEFFGLKPEQTKIQFGKEYQMLNNDDRKEVAAGLMKLGYNIDPATIEKK